MITLIPSRRSHLARYIYLTPIEAVSLGFYSVASLHLVFCFFSEARVETVTNHTSPSVLVETDRRNSSFRLKYISLQAASESRGLVLQHLFFYAFDQTPAILMLILLESFSLESLLRREEGRFCQLALLKLFCHLDIFSHSSCDIRLTNVIATNFDLILLWFFKTLCS